MRFFALALFFSLFLVNVASAHCQVPCGIFTDDLRFSLMNEHAETILKCMKQIDELAKADKPDFNQIVRWTTTKDYHADDIIDICSNYFLCQRVKTPADPKNAQEQAAYGNKLELLHKLMVIAMKCKQSTDAGLVDQLKALIHDFERAYNPEHKH
ncbi:MAG: superoxide dismutase [Candidatus Riflebacteria bacterium]|nr:superoxide dismutase [Candidatus Riflebacteria bacterium]